MYFWTPDSPLLPIFSFILVFSLHVILTSFASFISSSFNSVLFLSPDSFPHLTYLFCFLAVILSTCSLSHIRSLLLHERFMEQTRKAHPECCWWKRLQDISSVMSEQSFFSLLMTENSVRCSIFSFSIYPCRHFPFQSPSVSPLQYLPPFPFSFKNFYKIISAICQCRSQKEDSTNFYTRDNIFCRDTMNKNNFEPLIFIYWPWIWQVLVQQVFSFQ